MLLALSERAYFGLCTVGVYTCFVDVICVSYSIFTYLLLA